MRRTNTIPAAEQVALCRRAQAGDLAARNALVTASMGLVYSVAKRWMNSSHGLELDELAADGSMGVIRAIEKFDCDRGLKFSTYAVHWIKHFVRQAHGDDAGIKRSDLHRSGLARDVRNLVAGGESRERAIEIVADRRGARFKTVREVVEALERGRPLSLDAPLGDSVNGETFVDRLADEWIDPVESIAAAERNEIVRRALGEFLLHLRPRERAIVERRILRDGDDDEATLADLGDDFDVSRERIRQIEVHLRESLRSVLEVAHDRFSSPKLPEVRAPKVRTQARAVVRPKPATQPAPIATVSPEVSPAPFGALGAPCRICGQQLRRHNRYGVCSKHGHETFDRATGRCLVCGVVVAAVFRGAHAVSHRHPPMGEVARKAKGRERQKTRRVERRARGACEGCGCTRAPGDSLCATCRQRARASGAALRRRRGQEEKRLVLLTHEGETMSLAAWSRRTGISLKIIWQRLFTLGWPSERAFEPVVSSNERRKQKQVCVNGHARTPENLWTDRRGTRHCRECGRQRCRDQRAKAREATELVGRLPLSRAS